MILTFDVVGAVYLVFKYVTVTFSALMERMNATVVSAVLNVVA